ncbi:phage tail length tape measure family protein [Neorhizobium sp. T786]|uniref:phage tail length tape measure family protein n=1 Tax=Pseudorhizobium xiangyangii TaxID=2883104 RepID=UPI001D0009E9|nr:phage tail length tape measure family protein [Neorhizobium xiangyangii]MCB5201882.1 phage tail length tape measure family protein [Neorhizobium xiangyangii]
MATDNEQLVLSISADTRQIQRQLKTLIGQTQRDTTAIENAFGGIDKAASGAFAGVVANSNRAGRAGADAGRKLETAMKGSAVQTSNLAAQLNDIGVQLAGGQSPFLIALQQGTQINQVLGQGGARAAVGALAGAFTSLINPVSIATIAIIGLGGTAIQYFSTLFSEGEKSEETLKKQADLIRAMAKEWGDAVPALREYSDELERASRAAELNEAGGIINERALADTRTQIDDAAIAITDLVSQLQSAGEETGVITGLQTAFNDFASAAEDGSLKVEDVKSVQDALATAINSTGIPALADFKTMFDQLAGSALGASDAVRQTNAAIAQAQARMNDPRTWRSAGRTDQFGADATIQGQEFNLPDAGPTPSGRPTIELGTDDGSKAASRAGKSRAKAISEAERERKAVSDLIEQLEFEQQMISATDAERAEANALRRAGAAATEEQKAKIAELVAATYAERDAIKASKEAMQELKAVGRDVLEGIVSDLKAGKSAADILANALGRIADKLMSSALDGLFGGIGSIFGGGGFAALPKTGPIPTPRERGGPVTAGQPYVVGEKRPELFVPNVSGRIIPKVPGGTTSINFAPVINAPGADKSELAAVRRDLARMKAELPGTVKAVVRDGQKRRQV